MKERQAVKVKVMREFSDLPAFADQSSLLDLHNVQRQCQGHNVARKSVHHSTRLRSRLLQVSITSRELQRCEPNTALPTCSEATESNLESYTHSRVLVAPPQTVETFYATAIMVLEQRTCVPEPPKLRRNFTGIPVAASYSSAKRSVMTSYAFRVTAKETSVRCTVPFRAFFFRSSLDTLHAIGTLKAIEQCRLR